ncbi:MAG TPA: phosphodiester glycosidase family protein [Candidatus Desulfovibrio intestinavium]|uniref:Phosphodiester glycosidase family protein n=1 Tax=Candidatus Desulfovibrio intestinavium TaxID=2838534 RepID=A0A9D2HLF9_9BACT|nr:phosphodiester glycosidase family protein [Candidatus Desulfovibrio intestinavium]
MSSCPTVFTALPLMPPRCGAARIWLTILLALLLCCGPCGIIAARGAEAAGTPPPPGPPQADADTQAIAWTERDGLALAELPLPLADGKRGPVLAVLRLSPEQFDFVLCAAGRERHPPLTLVEWADLRRLTAVINASMFLPDGVTSTGYLREGDYINNKRLGARLGAFFVAGPDSPELPRAAIIERSRPDWEERIARYRLVIQNYRLISGDGQILWKPGGPRNAISAVAEDMAGNILFLHCREPLDAHSFAAGLLRLPLQVRTVMYVEGGRQAGLLLRSGDLRREYNGLSAAEFLPGGTIRAALPNVLGARPRADLPAAPPPARTP